VLIYARPALTQPYSPRTAPCRRPAPSIRFSDTAHLGQEAKTALALLRGLQVVAGDGERFYPDRPITRAEAAVLLVRLILVRGQG
jgi:hypothetical protein